LPEPRVKQNCRDGRYRLCKIRRAGYGVCFQEQPCIADDQGASEAHGHDLADLPLHRRMEPGIDVPRNRHGQREQRRSEARQCAGHEQTARDHEQHGRTSIVVSLFRRGRSHGLYVEVHRHLSGVLECQAAGDSIALLEG